MTSDDAHRNEKPGEALASTSAAAMTAAGTGDFGAGDSQAFAVGGAHTLAIAHGQVLDGRYRIVAKLGEGGMGEVYAAEHVHIEKKVAIKLLRHEILTNAEAVSRFRQEARSASSIGHQNIIAIEDFGSLPDGRIYLCMELLEGQPLNDLLTQPLAPERILNILIQTCHGLAAAHRKGIVHRDMKPENIFVTRLPDGSDVPKLLDFGIAKVSGADGDNNLTRTGTIFGTPFYMSPEQALGQGVDHRADVYAMGVIMYQAFTGALPFQGESFMGILTKHITAEPTPPSRRALENGRVLPPGIEEIISRCMRKNPDERYATMDELIAELVALHRNLAGPGMSAYMEAHVPPSSASFGAVGYDGAPVGMATPAPMPRGPGAGHHPGYGGGYHPGPGAGMPVAHPHASGSHPMMSHGGHASRADMPRQGSKLGLIAAILAVFLVVGGGAGLLLMSGDRDGGGGGTTGEQAGNDTGQGGGQGGTLAGNLGTMPPHTGESGSGESGSGESGSGESGGTQGNGSQQPAGGDTGQATGDTGEDTQQEDGRTRTRRVPRIVLLASEPAAAVWQDGIALGKTPLNIRVLPGETVTVTLKRSGYQDTEIAMDGSNAKEVVTLQRRRRIVGGKDGDKSPGNQQGETKDPGKGAGDLNLGLE